MCAATLYELRLLQYTSVNILKCMLIVMRCTLCNLKTQVYTDTVSCDDRPPPIRTHLPYSLFGNRFNSKNLLSYGRKLHPMQFLQLLRGSFDANWQPLLLHLSCCLVFYFVTLLFPELHNNNISRHGAFFFLEWLFKSATHLHCLARTRLKRGHDSQGHFTECSVRCRRRARTEGGVGQQGGRARTHERQAPESQLKYTCTKMAFCFWDSSTGWYQNLYGASHIAVI